MIAARGLAHRAGRGGGGLAVLLFAAAALFAGVTMLMVEGCTATGVRTQAHTADTIARTLNRVAPVWIDEVERRALEAAMRLCPADAGSCDRDAMVAAADEEFDRYRPVAIAWDTAQVLHGVWRSTLRRCQDRGDDVCRPGEDAALQFVLAAQRWRCAVRALGRADLDPLPGTPTCNAPDAGTDGGTDHD